MLQIIDAPVQSNVVQLTTESDINLVGLSEQINAEHVLCMESAGGMLRHAIQAGEFLVQAKALCKHGEWLPWIETNCNFSASTAKRYIYLYENREKFPNRPRVVDLTLRGALKAIAGRENHQLINTSDNNEWYTPPQYIEAVHEVMGGIDLDPASCAAANKTVQATKFYTIDDDGFTKLWPGRVFLNPPYGREDGEGSNQARWSARLIEQFNAGITTEAILLVNAVPSNRWFAPLWDFLICFTDHRVRFYGEDGEFGQPTHSNCFVYMGSQVDTFASVFSRFGVVAVRYQIQNGMLEVVHGA